MHELIAMTVEECRTLLAANIVGRVGFDGGAGPRVHPVNYAMDGDGVVLRTAEGSELVRMVDAASPDGRTLVAFEVDHIDYDRHQGWSVLLVGVPRRVQEAGELDRIARQWSPRPWAGGDRDVVLRIEGVELSGRRLGTDWPGPGSSPVHRRP